MSKKIAFAAVAALAVVAAGAFVVSAQNEAGEAAPAENSAGAPAGTSTPAGWTENFEAAQAQAAAEGKDLFVLFTGSDWCIWCKRLAAEILAQPGVIKKISAQFVPVFIDLPNNQALLSEFAKTQNRELTDRFRIQGFPTVLLLDADGTEFGKIGYVSGGPEKFFESLEKIVAEGKISEAYKTKKALAAVPAGPERVKKLDEMLSTLPLEAQLKNMDGIAEILDADPDGSLGYRAKYPFFAVALPLEAEFFQIVSELSYAAQQSLVTKENPRGRPKDAAQAQEALTKIVAKNPARITEFRAKAQAALAQFPPDSLGAKRIQNTIVGATQILQKTGIDPAGTPPQDAQ